MTDRRTDASIADETSTSVPFPEESLITLNRTVVNIRRSLGLSQKELAELLQVDYVWLSQLENERLPINTNFSTIMALVPTLATIADLDASWLRSLRLKCRSQISTPAVFAIIYKAEGRK